MLTANEDKLVSILHRDTRHTKNMYTNNLTIFNNIFFLGQHT